MLCATPVSSMRHETAFLLDIFVACGKIEAIVRSHSEASFLDEVLPPAVLHHLTVIGEAIGRLPNELRLRHPQVAWRLIVAVRNRIMHGYFDLDWQILWDAAIEDVPTLRAQVADILRLEFPDIEIEVEVALCR